MAYIAARWATSLKSFFLDTGLFHSSEYRKEGRRKKTEEGFSFVD